MASSGQPAAGCALVVMGLPGAGKSTLVAGLAGLSGVLYTAWGNYITPSSMGMSAAALPVVWVAVGGRSDLTTTLFGPLLVLAGFQSLTIYGSQYALVVMGVLLVVTILAAPSGIFITVGSLFSKGLRRRLKRESV